MIRICEMYICSYNFHTHRNPKNTKHWRLSWFRYETIITFFKFRFFDTRRERHIFYTDSSSIVSSQLTDPTNAHKHPLGPKINSHRLCQNLNSPLLFKITKPIASGNDVIHIPSPIFYLGFLLWHLWFSHPLCARLNTCVNVCTYPCTKPKGSKPN